MIYDTAVKIVYVNIPVFFFFFFFFFGGGGGGAFERYSSHLGFFLCRGRFGRVERATKGVGIRLKEKG